MKASRFTRHLADSQTSHRDTKYICEKYIPSQQPQRQNDLVLVIAKRNPNQGCKFPTLSKLVISTVRSPRLSCREETNDKRAITHLALLLGSPCWEPELSSARLNSAALLGLDRPSAILRPPRRASCFVLHQGAHQHPV